jgi:uncharacterized membrane protein
MKELLAKCIAWVKQERHYTLTKDKTKLFLTVALIIASVGDIVTTLLALSAGGYEANPFMKLVVNPNNPLPLILVKGLFIILVIIYFNELDRDESKRYAANYIILLPTLLLFAAIINNIYQLSLLL